MAKYLNGTGLVSGIQAGMTNSYNVLSGLYANGLTRENLVESMSNQTLLTSGLGSTFSSYLSNNFANVDKNADGTLTADEVQKIMTQIANQGLTREQITQLGSLSGISADMQGTILDHFTEIDTNHDGKVSAGEIQAYNLTSKKEQRRVEDENRMIKNTSIFYGDEDKEFSSSLLSYKWLQE